MIEEGDWEETNMLDAWESFGEVTMKILTGSSELGRKGKRCFFFLKGTSHFVIDLQFLQKGRRISSAPFQVQRRKKKNKTCLEFSHLKVSFHPISKTKRPSFRWCLILLVMFYIRIVVWFNIEFSMYTGFL